MLCKGSIDICIYAKVSIVLHDMIKHNYICQFGDFQSLIFSLCNHEHYLHIITTQRNSHLAVEPAVLSRQLVPVSVRGHGGEPADGRPAVGLQAGVQDPLARGLGYRSGRHSSM